MFAKPDTILSGFGVESGWHVADLGSGAGHYTLLLSELVGPSGRVYAIDVQPELLKKVKDLGDKNRRENIDVIRGDIEEIGGTHLKDASLDAVVASNVFFQIEEKGKFIAEIRRILKPRGRLLLADWSDSFNHMGPHPDAVIPEDKAEKLFEQKGFKVERKIAAGEHHYAIVFRLITEA